jgi:hypothetical protein
MCDNRKVERNKRHSKDEYLCLFHNAFGLEIGRNHKIII